MTDDTDRGLLTPEQLERFTGLAQEKALAPTEVITTSRAVVMGAAIIGIKAVALTLSVKTITREGAARSKLTIDGPGSNYTQSRETAYRVREALAASAHPLGAKEYVVSWAPEVSYLQGTGLDLAIATAILVHDGVLTGADVEGTMFFGELGLNGAIRQPRGTICAAEVAGEENRLFTAVQGGEEAALIRRLNVVTAIDLSDMIHLIKAQARSRVRRQPRAKRGAGVDFSQIAGHVKAKRALEIAAAGGHHIQLVGAPGGKILLARALPTLLPPLLPSERILLTKIYSTSGLRLEGRPFRAPHYTTSFAGLVGGGTPARVGEATLAHRGVLLLDDAPEFQRHVLEALSVAIKDREVSIHRPRFGPIRFPCRPLLICTLNSCPYGHQAAECECSPKGIRQWQSRMAHLSPLIDLHVDLDASAGCSSEPESSEAVAKRVAKARRHQLDRAHHLNSNCDLATLERWCHLGEAEKLHLARETTRLEISARSWHKIIKVARTICDLQGRALITVDDLTEALTFIPPEITR